MRQGGRGDGKIEAQRKIPFFQVRSSERYLGIADSHTETTKDEDFAGKREE